MYKSPKISTIFCDFSKIFENLLVESAKTSYHRGNISLWKGMVSMIRLKELLELPIFQNFRLVAGLTGLSREVRNVDILEYEWMSRNFDVFHPDDLVLTSLFFAKDDPSLIQKSFEKLAARAVTAIAVKTVFYTEMPEDVLAFCNAHDLPLFLFDGAFMEDIIVNFNDVLKLQQSHLQSEQQIHDLLALLAPARSPYAVEAAVREINPAFQSYVTAFYLIHRRYPGSPREVAAFLARTTYKQYSGQALDNVTYRKYQNGLLVLYTSRERELPSAPEVLCQRLLSRYDTRLEEFYCGSSETLPTFRALPTAIQQSIDACQMARETEASTSYGGLGIHRLLFPMSRDETLRAIAREAVGILKAYDEKYTSNLLDTCRAYIAHHGEISKTAAALYQHPNTIRYRLKKAESLLEPVIGKEDVYEQLYFLLRLYDLGR